ncbi:hypothetical protein [Sutcliffiella rhizosphaerae]|uniref:Uncharacterized protein n=1 Tax=Sutcliffiella rhizosphaerae TaxID=2880967 RepID=A0ABM8YPQ3_9BACI|nr:hypothetical protein [Sutcliffiella rhizosphaerae]CAG9621786.1 hypothetical protein BACCIP111883_02559 [Sutcliffiella rhizosphaerae]
MEIYDYMMLLNVLAIIASVMVGYLYVSLMVMRKGAFLFHAIISLSFIVFTWFTTTSIWYFMTIQVDSLLYTSGMLFNMITTIFCTTVYLAYLSVQRSYMINKFSKKHQPR